LRKRSAKPLLEKGKKKGYYRAGGKHTARGKRRKRKGRISTKKRRKKIDILHAHPEGRRPEARGERRGKKRALFSFLGEDGGRKKLIARSVEGGKERIGGKIEKVSLLQEREGKEIFLWTSWKRAVLKVNER